VNGPFGISRCGAESQPKARWRAGAVFVCFTVLMLTAGCVATPGTIVNDNTGLRDRVTASDESLEARRGRVRLELASAYFARGQLSTALDEVKLAIAADPTMAPAFNLRGLIYSQFGDAALAEDSFRRALALNGRDADVLHNFGWHLCRERRFSEADQQFAQALALPAYRDMVRTLLARGVCQARAGQYAAAEVTLVRATELDPFNPALSVNLAEVLLRRGEFERARFLVRRVQAVPENVSAETLWLAARIENRLGNRAALGDLGAQLVNRFPQSPEARAFQRGGFDE
jgi:type IV pilus assembly protein PilF